MHNPSLCGVIRVQTQDRDLSETLWTMMAKGLNRLELVGQLPSQEWYRPCRAAPFLLLTRDEGRPFLVIPYVPGRAEALITELVRAKWEGQPTEVILELH